MNKIDSEDNSPLITYPDSEDNSPLITYPWITVENIPWTKSIYEIVFNC